MDNGDRNPERDSAAAEGRTSAIESAFAALSKDIDFGDDDLAPAAPSPSPAETPKQDAVSDSAGTDALPEGETKEEKPSSEANARPVEEPKASPVANATLEAPKHWSKDRRAKYADLLQSLPDDAKELTAAIILERNKEANVAVTKSQQEAAAYKRTSEAVASVFNDDHRKQMQSSGLDEIGAIRYLVQQHDALNRDPVGFLKAVIAQTGVKPEQLFGAQAPAQQPGQAQPQADASAEWEDPAVVALREQVIKLQETEANRARAAVEHQRREAQRFKNWFDGECSAFELAIDDEGNPKYAHLDAVLPNVIRLVQSDPALVAQLRSNPQAAFEQAYNQALYLNPDIRQSIIDAEHERRMSEFQASQSVQRAQASTTRKGSPGANGVAKPKLAKMTSEEHVDKAGRDLGLW